jgi:hypothetical protein
LLPCIDHIIHGVTFKSQLRIPHLLRLFLDALISLIPAALSKQGQSLALPQDFAPANTPPARGKPPSHIARVPSQCTLQARSAMAPLATVELPNSPSLALTLPARSGARAWAAMGPGFALLRVTGSRAATNWLRLHPRRSYSALAQVAGEAAANLIPKTWHLRRLCLVAQGAVGRVLRGSVQ